MSRLSAFATKKNQLFVLFNLLVGVTFTIIALEYAMPVLPETNNLAIAQTIGIIGLVAVVMPIVVLAEMICFSVAAKSARLVKNKRAQ